MGRLKGYAKSSNVMNIDITFDNEQFHFNLYDELKVSEEKINTEIMEQPTVYAFLTTLLARLGRVRDDKEKEMEKKFSEVYNRYKERLNENTGRVYDKEYAHHIAMASPLYQNKRSEFIIAKENFNRISAAVKAFEQRGFLIQTLSANKRKEI